MVFPEYELPINRCYCPNAERCIDPFHVVQWATDALDEVRRQAWSEAHREAKKAKDSKVKDAAEKQKKATDLKGTRYTEAKIDGKWYCIDFCQ